MLSMAAVVSMVVGMADLAAAITAVDRREDSAIRLATDRLVFDHRIVMGGVVADRFTALAASATAITTDSDISRLLFNHLPRFSCCAFDLHARGKRRRKIP